MPKRPTDKERLDWLLDKQYQGIDCSHFVLREDIDIQMHADLNKAMSAAMKAERK